MQEAGSPVYTCTCRTFVNLLSHIEASSVKHGESYTCSNVICRVAKPAALQATYSITTHAAQVSNLAVQVCCQSMHASSTCKRVAMQQRVSCIALAPVLMGSSFRKRRKVYVVRRHNKSLHSPTFAIHLSLGY